MYCSNDVALFPEGKHLARRHGCKYAEVSALLNHMVDRLLVGIVRRMRLGEDGRNAPFSRQESENNEDHSLPVTTTKQSTPFGCFGQMAVWLFPKIFAKTENDSYSGVNLFVHQ